MLWTMHYLTLDGVMADPHMWHPTYAGEDAYALTRAHIEEAGAADSVMVAGSGRLVRALLAAGLVDEMRLTVDPLVRGHGLRLLPDGVPSVELELVDQRSLSNGVQYLAYRPVAA